MGILDVCWSIWYYPWGRLSFVLSKTLTTFYPPLFSHFSKLPWAGLENYLRPAKKIFSLSLINSHFTPLFFSILTFVLMFCFLFSDLCFLLSLEFCTYLRYQIYWLEKFNDLLLWFSMIEKCPWMGHLHLFGEGNVPQRQPDQTSMSKLWTRI